jgi:hypothetical protein
MTPTLVTGPVSAPIDLAAAKLHCRVDHGEDDMLIRALIDAAVGHLDGWTGVLGRCMMPQTWRVTVKAGEVILPMPDVTAASAAYEAGATQLVVTASARGPSVTVTEDCDVSFTCAMPAGLLGAAAVTVLLLVGHWYANREAVGVAMVEVPLSVDALANQMRWRWM